MLTMPKSDIPPNPKPRTRDGNNRLLVAPLELNNSKLTWTNTCIPEVSSCPGGMDSYFFNILVPVSFSLLLTQHLSITKPIY